MSRTDTVVIKSNAHGLTLVLDRDVSFEKLVKDICQKFATSRDFFGKRSLILSLEGRDFTGEEVAVIVDAIQLNSDITISLIEENNELKDIAMSGKIDRFYYENLYENAKIIMGSVSRKEKISSDSSIIILGDVKSKASVVAAANVLVMGSIEGEVIAGYPNDNNCFICANDIDGASLKIGSVEGQPQISHKWSLRSKKSNTEPYAVVVFENELLAEPLRSGLLKNR